MFKTNIINELKHFQFGCEEIKGFIYIDIELVYDSDLSISVNQNNYISSIRETVLPTEKTKDKTSLLSNEEKKLYRSTVG